MPKPFAVIAFLSLLLLAVTARASEDPQTSLAEGMQAPNWMMSDIDGNSRALYTELEAGNDVIMVFWASWCRFCKELLPELNVFQTSLSNEPVKIFAMNIWEDGDPVGFFESNKIQLPLILNADAIGRRYGVRGTPGVVYVASDKTIRYMRSNREDTLETLQQLQQLVLSKHLKHPGASN